MKQSSEALALDAVRRAPARSVQPGFQLRNLYPMRYGRRLYGDCDESRGTSIHAAPRFEPQSSKASYRSLKQRLGLNRNCMVHRIAKALNRNCARLASH